MPSVRRINILAGPGAGKSTLAARLFSELKSDGYDVEHITEYIKTWAYQKRKPQSFDQLYVFAKQLNSEDLALREVNHIITDSPLIVNVAYSQFYGCNFAPELLSIVNRFEQKYPSLNLFIERSVEYVDKGRYQTPAEAIEFDTLLWNLVTNTLLQPIYKIHVNDIPSILSILEQELNNG